MAAKPKAEQQVLPLVAEVKRPEPDQPETPPKRRSVKTAQAKLPL